MEDLEDLLNRFVDNCYQISLHSRGLGNVSFWTDLYEYSKLIQELSDYIDKKEE